MMPPASLRCPACGRPFPLRVPAVCPDCGCPIDRPPEAVAPKPGAVTLIEGTTDDDGKPYTVVGGRPIPRCPECDARLPAEDAPRCDHCGWDRATGRKIPKTYAPIRRMWEGGWPLQTRLVAFGVCQALNVGTVALIFAEEGRAVTTVFGFIVAVAMQALLLGTFDRLDLVRSSKGKVTLTQRWRIAFWPLEPKTLRWRECEEIRVMHGEAGCLEWAVFLMLLGSTLIGGLLFYWFVIRPGPVKAALCKDLGDPAAVLYLGTSTERAEEIARTVSEATNMPWRPHGG